MIDFIKIPKKYKRILLKNQELKFLLEQKTKTKINVKDDVEIEGESVDVYIAKNVLKAFSRGFSFEDSIKLLDDNYSIDIINLSDFTSSDNRIKVIASRIIGSWDNLNKARQAIMMFIDGNTHKSVYRWLEQNSKVVDW